MRRSKMKITQLDVMVTHQEPNPTPIRDALQTLPGSGSVQVRIETVDGVTGRGEVGFGRIAGAPQALAALIEHELKPLILNQSLTDIRALYEHMLRETEYHGA